MQSLPAQSLPVSAIIGGILIGLSIAVIWVFNGRQVDTADLIANAQSGRFRHWEMVFLIALAIGGAVAAYFAPLFGLKPNASGGVLSGGLLHLIVGAFLIGVGTRLAGAIGFGPEVHGLARLAPRALVAIAVFIGSALLTLTLFGVTT